MKNTLVYRILKGKKSGIFLFLLLFSAVLSAQEEPSGSLIITFTQIRSDVGNLVIGVYESEEQWVHHPCYKYIQDKNALKNDTLCVEIKDLPYGSYAISVLDDEDLNDAMKFLLKLPQEGWGMSGNPPFLKLRAPEFELCSFDLDCSSIQFEIQMNYINRRKKVK